MISRLVFFIVFVGDEEMLWLFEFNVFFLIGFVVFVCLVGIIEPCLVFVYLLLFGNIFCILCSSIVARDGVSFRYVGCSFLNFLGGCRGYIFLICACRRHCRLLHLLSSLKRSRHSSSLIFLRLHSSFLLHLFSSIWLRYCLHPNFIFYLWFYLQERCYRSFHIWRVGF